MSYVGKKVVLMPGAVFWSNHPKRTGPRFRHQVYRFIIEYEEAGEKPFVQWRYHGHYWAWTHPDNVRVIDPPSFLADIVSKINATGR